MSQPLIDLRGVHKRFLLPGKASFDAVRDVSLQIASGEIVGIIGESGAGKSTLLRLINLLECPDAGEVHVNGRDMLALDKRALREQRRRIGMIFQQFNLLQNLTVAGNVAFPLRIAGVNRSTISARVDESLERVGLIEKRQSYPAQLSGGQKQRIGIARALVTQPDILLCDEPTSALDSQTTRGLLELLRELHGALGLTIVLVTHELAVARALCERVLVMEKGSLVEEIDLRKGSSPDGVLRRLVAMPRTELARELLAGSGSNAYA